LAPRILIFQDTCTALLPYDVHATELRFSLSFSLSLSSSTPSSCYANPLRRARSRTFGRRMHYSWTMSWLRTILYELPRGHFGDGVNPRIVIGKFPTIPWDISSGTDGHDFSPRNPSWLLIVNTDFSRVVCARPFARTCEFYVLYESSYRFRNLGYLEIAIIEIC